jgi:DNA-binding NtrC family response regulator
VWNDALGAHEVTLGERVAIGSAPRAELVIADSLVSRIHAELVMREDGLWVRDLGSRNGTYVNGVRVESARLDAGLVLRVGATGLQVRLDGTPEEIVLWPEDGFGDLRGRSVAARELFAKLARVANTDSTVLVQGETGTGKELVGRAIHEHSRRHAGPYVIVDCGSIPEPLLESELFGHAKGAFTGAVGARNGAFVEADGGTIFLDEIGELPGPLQPKLLRFLETRTVKRLGESSHRKVDVRVIAATHRDLRTMVNTGAFREDLYFRLAVLPIWIPPLRERAADIELLVEHCLPAELRGQLFTPAMMAELQRRPWPGNVRELRNFVERCVAFGPGWALAQSAATPAAQAATGLPPVLANEPFKDVRDRWIAHLERAYLSDALKQHQGSVQAVAEASGLDRSYVYRLVLKHGLR